ncbi:FAD/NAD(P)-binding protein, partial [Streptomyces sp. NPDC057638]|uniref:FAD/NAD(P)-binding protein n=1 Tax=Streptomyces sp. NPDC057638 TaxID=3346190 RepID=UPI003685B4B7
MTPGVRRARPSLAIAGTGPRGTGVRERRAASLPERYGNRPLDLHLSAPFAPGAGRIRRAGQSPCPWTDPHTEDVTRGTDERGDGADPHGPLRPGPTLAAWAGTGGRSLADRRRQGVCPRWFHRRAVAALPPQPQPPQPPRAGARARVPPSRAG